METNNAIKTSHLVKIHKIFRGHDLPASALECGTVEVITQGGAIVENGVEVDWADHSVSPSGPLGIGGKCLMLLFPTTAPSLNRSTTNSVTLFLSPRPSLYPYKTYPWPNDLPVVSVWDRKFYDIQDFYQYLDSLGLPMEECLPLEPLNEQGKGINLKEKQKKTKHKPISPENKKGGMEEFKKHTPDSQKKRSSSNAELNLELINPRQSSDSANQYFEFDIMLSASTDSFFLDILLLKIKYDTMSFGSYIASNTFYLAGNEFNNSSYADPNYFGGNDTFNITKFEIWQDFGNPNRVRTQVTTSPKHLVTAKFIIQNCDFPADISLFDVSYTTSGNAFYTDSVGGTYYYFKNVNFYGSFNYTLCQPAIDFFTPSVCGGVGDTLIIRGFNFGNTRGNGQVQLRDADKADVNTELIEFLDDLDYLT
jgi:hypothetical protein